MTANNPESANSALFQRYVALYRQGDMEPLLKAYKKENGTLPAEAHELAGLAALKAHQWELAKRIFTYLVRVRDSIADHYHLGLALKELGDTQPASLHLKEAAKDAKLRVGAVLNLAELALRQNDAQTALTSLLRLKQEIAHWPQQARWLEARALFLLRNFEAALAALELPGTNDNTPLAADANTLSLKAAIYLKMQRYDEAVSLFQELVNKQGQNPEHWYNLAAALSNLTDTESLKRGIEASDECLKRNPGHHRAAYTKALCWLKMGETSKAIPLLEQVLQQQPEKREYRLRLATAYSDLGHHQEGIACLLAQGSPLSARQQRQLGIIMARSGDYARAEAMLAKAHVQNDCDQRTIAYLALSRLAQGHERELREFVDTDYLLKKFQIDPRPEFNSVDEFNRRLAQDIKQHSRLRLNPLGLAARNGHLTDDLMADRTPAILKFHAWLKTAIEDYLQQMPDNPDHPLFRHKKAVREDGYVLNLWATWVKGDGFIDKHIHEESWISGAYYVTVPKVVRETSGSNHTKGHFAFGCVPADLRLDRPVETKTICPREGELLIFPSYLYHQTIPHQSDEDRISIAFDLTPKTWLQQKEPKQ